MITVTIHKADPLAEPVKSVRVDIDREFPKDMIHFDDIKQTCDDDAKALEEALQASLPRGTYNRLHQLITERIASGFKTIEKT